MEPEWNESFSFRNIDDEDLQEKYFEITVMDKDQYVKDKLIGTVIIDLSHLLYSNNIHNLDAEYPIFNVDKGLRGHLQV